MAFSIILTEKGGPTQRLDFDAEEITVGRVDENDICLPKGNISKKHTRIVVKDGKIIVLDLKSTNGTYVNGKKLAGPQLIQPSDNVYIGDFILNVEPPDLGAAAHVDAGEDRAAGRAATGEDVPAYTGEEATHRAGRPAPPANEDAKPTPAPGQLRISRVAVTTPSPRPPISQPAPRTPARGGNLAAADRGRTLSLVHDRLIEAMDLRRLDLDALGSGELREKTEATLRQIVGKMDAAGVLDALLDRDELVSDVLNEALGLGPLEIYLADDTVSEIMVNAPSEVYVERAGRLERAQKGFSSPRAVLGAIERIVAPLGRHVDESSPFVDARLPDGSRVNAIIPPLALKGPALTIRKFKRDLFTAGDLVERGTMTGGMAGFLETCVKARRNVVVSGGTGSGKTTLLNVLSGYIPEGERIVTIEDAAELQLAQEHWVQLESRPPNIEGKGAVTIRDLVRNALRMRPDRIVVGECRGGEALDMLQAMNTGHDGSLTTLHSNSPRDALARLETLVLMSGMQLPARAIREQVASAVNLVVQQQRYADGTRRISAISEVCGIEGEAIAVQDLFLFTQEGFDAEGRVVGRFAPTGVVPAFYEELQRRGVAVDMDAFQDG
ncbi:MAG: FHA domain-containing protein [Deltaproteobacteria bacterium]|nr:MAG: FHA domain-containing protein [Deltaproteobacteria bacterium]